MLMLTHCPGKWWSPRCLYEAQRFSGAHDLHLRRSRHSGHLRSSATWLEVLPVINVHMVDIWLVYGWCMVNVWLIYGWCMVDIWLMYGWCMVDIWLMYGWWMVDVWLIIGWLTSMVDSSGISPCLMTRLSWGTHLHSGGKSSDFSSTFPHGFWQNRRGNPNQNHHESAIIEYFND